MNVETISKHYHKLSNEQKKRFHINFFWLTQLCESALSLRGPYKFVLDSNIVMRLEDIKKENYLEGLLSIMLFFDFYKKQNLFKADIVITPIVFYEFFRLKKVENLRSYWEKFKSVRSLIEDTLDVEIFNENLDSFENTEQLIELIEYDHEIIRKNLIEINKKSFCYNFVQKNGVAGFIRSDGLLNVPPEWAADQLYKEVKTKYFNPLYVGMFLKDHITYKLSTNPNNDLEFANQFENEFVLRKVLHLDNKTKVRGLADIELLSNCNVRHQFNYQRQGNYYPASIPLTIDNNLGLALTNMSQLIVSHEMVGGENIDDMNAKADSAHDDVQRRMGRAEIQQLSYMRLKGKYMMEVSELFD